MGARNRPDRAQGLPGKRPGPRPGRCPPGGGQTGEYLALWPAAGRSVGQQPKWTSSVPQPPSSPKRIPDVSTLSLGSWLRNPPSAKLGCFVPVSDVYGGPPKLSPRDLGGCLNVPVACKSCPCGYIFISRKLLNAKHPEKSPSSTENKHEAKRRRTERVRREKINSTVNKDLENRKRSRSNSHSDHIRRGRGRPKSASAKKHEEEREKQEKEIDIYANLSDEKAFVFSVALAEINRKIINQRLIL
ncbi:UPF0547 protein C16orf87 homolog [Neophocaena asiaeorientalis asiaeorientalis]|uniref:UPF0547 protein C16orf87 homolog n=2 Tax=Artiodactyla TaxID=91561 RepID=A0A341BZX9_NEOAA|nr:UPF0547 protein C16orf87 homolog [Neophocaena asiaeorientalis asiaeorientalis]